MESYLSKTIDNGVFILTVPQHQWLWSEVDVNACHVRRYNAKQLHQKLSKAGFEIERSTSFVSLLLPLMLLSRLIHRKSTNRSKVSSELNLPRWLNVLFSGVMKLERGLIKLGINFPLGGSRLVVARKLA